jgi:hypothetical protein
MLAFLLEWAAKGIVSFGAGTGYLESVLAHRSLFQKIKDLVIFWRRFRVVAFDIVPPDTFANQYHGRRTYFPVQLGDFYSVADYPDLTLLLAWPEPGASAVKALRSYKGNRFIYIGDIRYNADRAFLEECNRHWRREDTEFPVRWCIPGLDLEEQILVFRRSEPDD